MSISLVFFVAPLLNNNFTILVNPYAVALDKGDDLVSISQVSKMFPNVKFSKDKCNPCDSNCSFSISTTTEQLSVEEDLKPKPSKQFRTSKEQAVGNSEPGPSPPIRISKNKSANSSQIEK